MSTAAFAAEPDTATASCGGVFNGGGEGPLTKTVLGETDNGDGTFTVRFRLDTPRAPSSIERVRDCAFVDTNGNGSLDRGEPLFGTDQRGAFTTPVTISITVIAKPGDTLCDRAAVSGTAGGSFTDKSTGADGDTLVCHTLAGGPPPVVPEIRFAVLLPLSAGLVFAAVFLALRRHRFA